MAGEYVGRLIKDGKMIAALGKDGRWLAREEVLVQYLNTQYNPHEATGFALVMPFGVTALRQAGARLGAEVKLDVPVPQGPEIPDVQIPDMTD